MEKIKFILIFLNKKAKIFKKMCLFIYFERIMNKYDENVAYFSLINHKINKIQILNKKAKILKKIHLFSYFYKYNK